MWKVITAYLTMGWPRAAATAVALVVAFTGGYSSLPQFVRPVAALDVPVIEPVVIDSEPVAAVTEAFTIEPRVDCARVACIALTFDDGPDAEYTPKILDILDAHSAKATFFALGYKVNGNEGLLQRMHVSGHEIGNHSWSHAKIQELSPQQLTDDIARAQQAITAAGVPAPKLFRPPYGQFNDTIRSHVPMTVIAWNVDPEDWDTRRPKRLADTVLATAKPGAIVVMHDSQKVTADALEAIVTGLQAQNYHLVTVTDLLGIPPGQPGIFYGR